MTYQSQQYGATTPKRVLKKRIAPHVLFTQWSALSFPYKLAAHSISPPRGEARRCGSATGGKGCKEETHCVLLEAFFLTDVSTRRMQNGQSTVSGWSPSMCSGVTVATAVDMSSVPAYPMRW